MERRFDEMRGQQLIATMEALSDQTVPPWVRKDIVHGADELDLVRSGLDNTMRNAYQELRETLNSNKKVKDFRTATYVVAIGKISRSYYDIGVY